MVNFVQHSQKICVSVASCSFCGSCGSGLWQWQSGFIWGHVPYACLHLTLHSCPYQICISFLFKVFFFFLITFFKQDWIRDYSTVCKNELTTLLKHSHHPEETGHYYHMAGLLLLAKQDQCIYYSDLKFLCEEHEPAWILASCPSLLPWEWLPIVCDKHRHPNWRP